MRWVLVVLVVVGIAVLVAPFALYGLGALALEGIDGPDGPDATPEATVGSEDAEALGPELGGQGHEPKPEQSPAQQRIVQLTSSEAGTADAALRWLRDAHEAGRLTQRDLFDIAMLVGLTKEAEAFRKQAFKRLTARENDLRPFTDDLLAMVRTDDETRIKRITWMLAQVLASWRHLDLVRAAEAAGKLVPDVPLAGRFEVVRAILLDPGVHRKIRVQLAERIAWLGEAGLSLMPAFFALVEESDAAAQAWREANPDKRGWHYEGGVIDRDVGYRLAEFGVGVLPHVLPLLRSPNDKLKSIAQSTLSALGAKAEPALLRALRDPDPQVREAAAWSLTWADDPSAERITALAEAARSDAVEDVRYVAAGALIHQGEGAVEVAAELLRGEDVGVRIAIIDSLEHEDQAIRSPLLEALVERYENPAEEEIPELLAIIENAGTALVPATYGILRLLPEFEDDYGTTSRQDLLLSLGDGALPWFLTALESDVKDLHHYAVRGLAWGGPLEGELRERALRLLRDDPDSPHRIWLAAAAAHERDPVTLGILDEALDEGPWETRHIAATTLAYMEGLGTRYLDRLVAASSQANKLYFDIGADKPHGMVGINVDIENAWKEVVKRDLDKAFGLLDHPDKHINRNAARILRYNAATVAPHALARWPSVSEARRGLYLELMSSHEDFTAVRDVLIEEAGHEPRTKPTKHGAPMPATAVLFDRAREGTVRTQMADRLAKAAVTGNLWAWKALLVTRKKDGAPIARAALRPYFEHEDTEVRTRARKLHADLEDD